MVTTILKLELLEQTAKCVLERYHPETRKVKQSSYQLPTN